MHSEVTNGLVAGRGANAGRLDQCSSEIGGAIVLDMHFDLEVIMSIKMRDHLVKSGKHCSSLQKALYLWNERQVNEVAAISISHLSLLNTKRNTYCELHVFKITDSDRSAHSQASSQIPAFQIPKPEFRIPSPKILKFPSRPKACSSPYISHPWGSILFIS